MKIDEQVFKDTKVFSYIPEMNKGDVDMKDVFKYKTHVEFTENIQRYAKENK